MFILLELFAQMINHNFSNTQKHVFFFILHLNHIFYQLRVLISARSTLTFTVSTWWVVKGEAQRYDGSDLEDDKSDILQSLPHQLQEGLGLLGGDEVLSECFMTVLQIKGIPRKTYRHRHKIHINRLLITSCTH